MATDPANTSETIQAEKTGQLPPKLLPECSRSRRWTVSVRSLFAVLASVAVLSPITLSIYLFVTVGPQLGIDQEYCGIPFASTAALIAPDATFGNFTIAQAKALDTSWNLIAGRGLQSIIGLISYRVGTVALLRITERAPISFELFETIALHPFSPSAILPLLRAYIRTTGWRARTTLVFLLLSVLLVIALPSLSDIATGYVQGIEYYGLNPGGAMFRVGSDSTPANCTFSRPISCATPEGEAIPLVCVPRPWYRWGFSSIWGITIQCIIGVWAFGMYGVWVDASRNSIQQRKGRTMGTWRAIADLGGAIDRELGPNLSTYSNAELKKYLNAAKPVMYTVKQDKERGVDQIVLSSRVTIGKSV